MSEQKTGFMVNDSEHSSFIVENDIPLLYEIYEINGNIVFISKVSS